MFSSITWEQYFFFFAFALLAYYIVVAIKYFKWEVLALVGIHKEERTGFGGATVPKFTSSNVDQDAEESEVDLSPVLQDFRDEVSAYIAEASTAKLSHNEVRQALQTIVAKYPVLNTPAQTMSRNDVITQELQNSEFAQMSEQDWQTRKV